ERQGGLHKHKFTMTTDPKLRIQYPNKEPNVSRLTRTKSSQSRLRRKKSLEDLQIDRPSEPLAAMETTCPGGCRRSEQESRRDPLPSIPHGGRRQTTIRPTA